MKVDPDALTAIQSIHDKRREIYLKSDIDMRSREAEIQFNKQRPEESRFIGEHEGLCVQIFDQAKKEYERLVIFPFDSLEDSPNPRFSSVCGNSLTS